MQTTDYHGWPDCIRLANDVIEVIASTAFGPRIMRLAFTNGGENLLAELEVGRLAPDETEWINYGGHRLWHAPEVKPRSYSPDNRPVKQAVMAGSSLILVQDVEPTTGIGKELRVQLGQGSAPIVTVEHVLTNHNEWAIEIAPWALSVVAPGGRVIIPQEPYAAHGANNSFVPGRPVVLWQFTDMADPRWKWGTNFIQLTPSESSPEPTKVGVLNSLGWAAYYSKERDLLIKWIDVETTDPTAYPDFGSNYETFAKGIFQELESLGPLQLLEPGEQATHTERWALVHHDGLPSDDAALADVLPGIVESARRLIDGAAMSPAG